MYRYSLPSVKVSGASLSEFLTETPSSFALVPLARCGVVFANCTFGIVNLKPRPFEETPEEYADG